MNCVSYVNSIGLTKAITRWRVNNIAFRSKADQPAVCTQLRSYDLHLDIMTLILDLDLDILKMYLRVDSGICRSRHSNVRARVKP